MPAHDNKIFKKNSYTEKADMQWCKKSFQMKLHEFISIFTDIILQNHSWSGTLITLIQDIYNSHDILTA